MDSIVIGFSRPKAFFEPFSWLIRLITWSKFSHAYIRYHNPYANRWIIFQASGLKVNIVGQALFNSQQIICQEFEIPVTTPTKLSTVQFAIDNIGKPYGLKQVAGFAWVLFMRVFRKKVKNPFYSNSSFFCSELAGDVWNEIVQPTDDIDPATFSPKDMCLFLANKGFKAPIN